MRVAIYYKSKYGNGRKCVERFGEVVNQRGHSVEVNSMKEANPTRVPPADLYVFSSPTRMGRPPRRVRSFLKKFKPPGGIGKYALITTHSKAEAERRSGRMPTEEDMARWRRTIPIMDEMLAGKGMRKIGDLRVFVDGIKGPLEDGYAERIEKFVDELLAKM